jgi:hypothetical protein
VEENLRTLGVKRWRRKALDIEEWAFTIKEAKVKLKGPKSYKKTHTIYFSTCDPRTNPQ